MPQRISRLAAQSFFLMIFLQIPLFRLPCSSGFCKTPLEITAGQMVVSQIIPPWVVKSLLYPGACLETLVLEKSLPDWNTLLGRYNLTNIPYEPLQVRQLGVTGGSYFVVLGALVGIVRPGRMNILGTVLLIWGLIKECYFGTVQDTDFRVYPTMLLALLFAYLSMSMDEEKLPKRTFRPVKRGPVRALKSSSKSKVM